MVSIAQESRLAMQLRKVVTRGRVLTASAQLAGYDADALGYKHYRPDAVVIPADVEELVAVMQAAKGLDAPVTLRGAGTSLSGGPVAAQGGVVVHTSSLKKIRKIDRAGRWCEVECSVVLNQLDAALAPLGLFYPPDPSSGAVCTLGGNVAMNAGGAHCFRHGVTANYVLGVEAVLLDGSVHRFGGPAGGRGGYREDWKRLMIGSEGTLAAFTRFWLRLLPRAEKAWTYRATFFDLDSAERAIHALAAHASYPTAIELMDPRCVAMVENSPMAVGLPKNAFLLVTEIDGPATLVDARAKEIAELIAAAGAGSVEFSDDAEQRARLWKARKVAGGLMGQLSPDYLVQDAVIPKRALADVLKLVYDEADAAGLPTVNVFHAGDGNLHPNFLFNSREEGELEKVEAISKRLMQRVVEVGGTLSGEHGIGNDKTAYMPLVFEGDALRLQLAIPRLFNPRHQLNPLKVFASRRFGDERTGDSSETTKGTQRGLFEPFLDPIDGVICASATMRAEELQAFCAPHRLRFPLLLDGEHTLAEQLAATSYAPASARFGAFGENVLGMNWRLPSGKCIRLGERVVKSTTGYDLVRFLLHASPEWGEATDYVLRLRPDCGMHATLTLGGDAAAVLKATPELLSTCWTHWFDAVDLLLHGENVQLRVLFNSPAEEAPVYRDYLAGFAQAKGLSMRMEEETPPLDGVPDVYLKTTPDRAVTLGCEIAMATEMRCIVIAGCGVVHGYLPPLLQSAEEGKAAVRELIARYEKEIVSVGGEWGSWRLPAPPASGEEAAWREQLLREFAA